MKLCRGLSLREDSVRLEKVFLGYLLCGSWKLGSDCKLIFIKKIINFTLLEAGRAACGVSGQTGGIQIAGRK